MIERWQDMTEQQVIDNLREIAGALRRLGRHTAATRCEHIANKIDPNPSKPVPIVPRTMSG